MQSFQMISEMKEFAGLSAAEQRYIGRSIDVAAQGTNASERWSRTSAEQARIDAQARLYRTLLPAIRAAIPEDIDLDASAELIASLVTLTAFDLGEERLTSFTAYRFLYERLLGGGVRPWLPSAFLAAAGLPYLHPATRQALLRSITEGDAAAPGWSHREPSFIPEWVEKVPVAVF